MNQQTQDRIEVGKIFTTLAWIFLFIFTISQMTQVRELTIKLDSIQRQMDISIANDKIISNNAAAYHDAEMQYMYKVATYLRGNQQRIDAAQQILLWGE